MIAGMRQNASCELAQIACNLKKLVVMIIILVCKGESPWRNKVKKNGSLPSHKSQT
jgi:hypothetical protein